MNRRFQDQIREIVSVLLSNDSTITSHVEDELNNILEEIADSNYNAGHEDGIQEFDNDGIDDWKENR